MPTPRELRAQAREVNKRFPESSISNSRTPKPKVQSVLPYYAGVSRERGRKIQKMRNKREDMEIRTRELAIATQSKLQAKERQSRRYRERQAQKPPPEEANKRNVGEGGVGVDGNDQFFTPSVKEEFTNSNTNPKGLGLRVAKQWERLLAALHFHDQKTDKQTRKLIDRERLYKQKRGEQAFFTRHGIPEGEWHIDEKLIMIQQRQRLLDAFLEKLGRGEGELPEPLGFEMGNDEIQPFGDKAQLLRNAIQNSKFLQMLWIHYTRKGHLYVWPEIEETRALHFVVHTHACEARGCLPPGPQHAPPPLCT